MELAFGKRNCVHGFGGATRWKVAVVKTEIYMVK
jgi:hypothetical protein